MLDAVKNYLKSPQWRSQHRWRRAIWHTMSRLGLTGIHALPLNRRWVDIQWRKMEMTGLDPAFAGKKIVQISDLHYSPVVWARYLLQYIQWVNDLEPDLVVVTGDLITGGYRFAHSNEGSRRADYLEKCLRDRGLSVLRNETFQWHVEGGTRPLAIVGLDDEWSDHIDPEKAWQGVDPTLPILCLNHNPANCVELMQWPWQWMLAGHTHGRQVATSRFGRAFYPHRFRHYTHGYYNVNGRHLYVNRGLSYGQRVLHWCRPEITVFKLESQAPPTPNTAHA